MSLPSAGSRPLHRGVAHAEHVFQFRHIDPNQQGLERIVFGDLKDGLHVQGVFTPALRTASSLIRACPSHAHQPLPRPSRARRPFAMLTFFTDTGDGETHYMEENVINR